MDWSRIRSEFPILHEKVKNHPLIYLDNAATSQKPIVVLDAIRSFYEHDNANVHRGMHDLSTRATLAYERARETVAGYIGASTVDEVVFTRGTTESLNLIAHTWASHFLRPGDVILLTEMEHHSNLVPWQLAAKRCGAHVKFIPVLDDGSLDMDAAWIIVGEGGVKVVACTHVSNTLGTINPVKELSSLAREAGAVSVIDGAQSAGHMPIDVLEIGCDFYVFSGHKMCGPTGIGVLYGRIEWLEQMPPWHGGGEMITSVRLDGCDFKPPPQRFEAGTPNIAGAVGLAAAVEFIERIGRPAIFEHDQKLIQHLVSRLMSLPGVCLLGPPPGSQRAAVAAFTLEAAHPHDIVTFANDKGLAMRGGHHCNQPLMRRFKVPGTIRASTYFYNSIEEIDQTIAILEEAVQFFARTD